MEKSRAVVLTSAAREAAVVALLDQYRAYQSAWFGFTKKKIGDAMKFADPIVWMRYKQQAYRGTSGALATWGDLVEHSLSHDGICGKRLQWLVAAVKQKCGVDLLDGTQMSGDTRLETIATLPLVEQIANDESLMESWVSYEYYEVDGVPKKWQIYTRVD